MKISQSFIKTMREYRAGEECGLVVKHQYVDGKPFERESEAMAVGTYFEYLVSKALPKSGKVPEAKMLKSGKEMDMHYKRATVNAERVKAILEKMGLKILHAGKKLTKGKFEGTIDLICEVTKDITFANGVTWKVGDRIIIDLKYSGLLYNKWEKLGWEWSNIQKEYHGTQAIQYHYVGGLPFYFLVVSNTNLEKENEDGKKEFQPTDMKLFYVPVEQWMIDKHIEEANRLEQELKVDAELGFVIRPSISRCSKCPLREECGSRIDIPLPEIVNLTIE